MAGRRVTLSYLPVRGGLAPEDAVRDFLRTRDHGRGGEELEAGLRQLAADSAGHTLVNWICRYLAAGAHVSA